MQRDFFIAKEFVQKLGEPNLYSAQQKELKEDKPVAIDNANKTQIAAAPPPTPASTPAPAPNPAGGSNPVYESTWGSPSPAFNPPGSTYGPPPSPYTIQSTNPPPAPRPAYQETTTYANTNGAMSYWQDAEQQLFQNWMNAHDPAATMGDFYNDQSKNAVILQGVIEPYQRAVKNKPGDFLLVSPSSRLPIAYLYSTQVNLQDKVGQEIVIQAVPRDNHNFAYPAYYVISAH